MEVVTVIFAVIGVIAFSHTAVYLTIGRYRIWSLIRLIRRAHRVEQLEVLVRGLEQYRTAEDRPSFQIAVTHHVLGREIQEFLNAQGGDRKYSVDEVAEPSAVYTSGRVRVFTETTRELPALSLDDAVATQLVYRQEEEIQIMAIKEGMT